MAAGEEMGYQNRDGNGEFQTGFMIPQVGLLFNSVPNDVLTSDSVQDLAKEIIQYSSATGCRVLSLLFFLFQNSYSSTFAIWFSNSIDHYSENSKILRKSPRFPTFSNGAVWSWMSYYKTFRSPSKVIKVVNSKLPDS